MDAVSFYQRAAELLQIDAELALEYAEAAVRVAEPASVELADALRVLASCWRENHDWTKARAALAHSWELLTPAIRQTKAADYGGALSYIFRDMRKFPQAATLAEAKAVLAKGRERLAAQIELGIIWGAAEWGERNLTRSWDLANRVLRKAECPSSVHVSALMLRIYVQTQEEFRPDSLMLAEDLRDLTALYLDLIPQRSQGWCEIKWLEGLAEVRLGDLGKARSALLQARKGFEESTHLTNYVLCSMDLISLEKKESNPGSVHRIAGELFPLLGAPGLEREQILVLRELLAAHRRDELSKELVRQIRRRFSEVTPPGR